MPFTFKPAILKQGTFYELPRPLLALRLQDAWDFEQFKVPLAAGDHTAGHSRNGLDISLEGQIGSHAGQLQLTEEQMLDTLESLRTALHVASPDDRYTFFLYHDEPTATYRCFQRCTTARFDFDLSNPHLFTWSALLHAEDPMLHTTLP